jgi:pimeloyl-ACP methyl ester carboxylesterase
MADRIAAMDLFVRETGPPDAPAVVFLHGGRTSGRSWSPVVDRLPGYRCLVPDLPHYGSTTATQPFTIAGAARAVADVIDARGGRAHLVGFSLGAQVGVHLLATAPGLVDRAVLCGVAVNTLPGVRLTQTAAALVARLTWPHRPRVAEIVYASSGFTVPAGLHDAQTPTLVLCGGGELPLVRRWSAALARALPHATVAVARGMRHEWPLQSPELFARTVDSWLTGGALPAAITPA